MRPTFAVPGAGYSQSDERRYRDDVAAAFARVMWSNEDTGVPVLSVFGRGGDVVAAVGDYDASKISPGTFPSGTFTFPSGLHAGPGIVLDSSVYVSSGATYLQLSRGDAAYTGIHLGTAGDSNYFTAPNHVFRDAAQVTHTTISAGAIWPQTNGTQDLGGAWGANHWRNGYFDGALILAAGSSVLVGGNQVLAARRTGWAAATGTATRTTFATSTVTTAQLAEHVKALLDDLIAHGVIGA